MYDLPQGLEGRIIEFLDYFEALVEDLRPPAFLQLHIQSADRRRRTSSRGDGDRYGITAQPAGERPVKSRRPQAGAIPWLRRVRFQRCRSAKPSTDRSAHATTAYMVRIWEVIQSCKIVRQASRQTDARDVHEASQAREAACGRSLHADRMPARRDGLLHRERRRHERPTGSRSSRRVSQVHGAGFREYSRAACWPTSSARWSAARHLSPEIDR